MKSGRVHEAKGIYLRNNLSVENLIRCYTLSVEKVVIFCKVRLANDRRVCRANRLDCFHYADM